MKVALAQLNPVVGDVRGNTAKIAEAIGKAADAGAELVVFSELAVLGYPPRDLLGKERVVAESVRAVESLAGLCKDIAAVVGFVRPAEGKSGRPLQNAAALLADGRVKHVRVKTLLPTYDVFDETRYFQPGGPPRCVEVAGRRVGITICEDIWDAEALGRDLYANNPLDDLGKQGAEIIVNLAASPYQVGKAAAREELIKRQAARSKAAILYVNQVGGNDELIFEGGSCAAFPAEGIVARAASFEEDILVIDTAGGAGKCRPLENEQARLCSALKLGLRDYLVKCGFSSIVLGLSGGIDSAVVAALAADALGPANVQAVAMPSRYSSAASLEDAQRLARNLKIPCRVVPIEPMHRAFEEALGLTVDTAGKETAAENIQARVRGNIVMAISNAEGLLPLATGNKSELATGYCTLYGDMCGGLAPIGDLLKTDVYRLADQLNEETSRPRIPGSIMAKPPSAELKPGQLDQDKLPPYELLDEILRRYIEDERTAEQIIAEGFDEDTVRRVAGMVDAAEYKRRQAPPVLKVTGRAFGTGRRMPIACRHSPPGPVGAP